MIKKVIITAALLLGAVGFASAQGRPAIKVDASVGFSKGDYKVENFSDFAGKAIVGYRFSAGVDVPLGTGLYVNPSLAFHSKGTKTSLKGLAGDVISNDIKATTHYIEIPIHLGYRVSLMNLVSVAVQAGPYFSYALSGKVDDGTSTYDIYKEGVNELFSLKGKRFDMGLGANAYVGYSMYYLVLGADFGLINTMDDLKIMGQNATSFDTVMKNTSFHVGLGVRF